MTSAGIVAQLGGPDPAGTLARLRAGTPVARVDALGGWFVTRHDLALAVLRDAGTYTVDDPRFSTAQVVGTSMLSTDGAAHRRHRDPFAPAFRAADLENRVGPAVRSLAADLVERIAHRGRADLRVEVAGPLSVAVMAQVLGLDDVDATTVLGWYTAIVQAVTTITEGRTPDDTARVAMAALADEVRRGLSGTETLLAGARGPLDDDEIVSNAAVMMFGGIETTEGMIGNAIGHLLGSDEWTARVRDDPDQVAPVVEESLRLEPAAAMVDRYATKDVELGGVLVRAGELVRVSLAGANRDPAVFERPDVFDPSRAGLRTQLAFARGPHACLAMELARLETRVALTTLVRRLPGLRATRPVRAGGLVFRKPATVPVAWDQAGDRPPPAAGRGIAG